MKKLGKKGGFTLIEILIVIAIIAILATIVLIAIDPARRFRDANNTSRQAHVENMADAIGLKIVDNRGTFLDDSGDCSTAAFDLPATEKTISSSDYNLAKCLVPKYLGLLPSDPKADTGAGGCTPDPMESPTDTTYDTCYKIIKTDGHITITAPNTEKETGATNPDISVTR